MEEVKGFVWICDSCGYRRDETLTMNTAVGSWYWNCPQCYGRNWHTEGFSVDTVNDSITINGIPLKITPNK